MPPLPAFLTDPQSLAALAGLLTSAAGLARGRQTTAQPTVIPGAFSPEQQQQLIQLLFGGLAQGTPAFTPAAIPAIARPEQATAETVKQLQESRQGTFNALGIGASPAAQASIAAAAAPFLAQLFLGLQQQQLQAAELGERQAEFAPTLQQRGQEINLQALLNALGLARPQIAQTGFAQRQPSDFLQLGQQLITASPLLTPPKRAIV